MPKVYNIKSNQLYQHFEQLLDPHSYQFFWEGENRPIEDISGFPDEATVVCEEKENSSAAGNLPTQCQISIQDSLDKYLGTKSSEERSKVQSQKLFLFENEIYKKFKFKMGDYEEQELDPQRSQQLMGQMMECQDEAGLLKLEEEEMRNINQNWKSLIIFS